MPATAPAPAAPDRLRALLGLDGAWTRALDLGPPPKTPIAFVLAASRAFAGRRIWLLMGLMAAGHAAMALPPWALGLIVDAVSSPGGEEASASGLAWALGLFAIATLLGPSLSHLAEIAHLRCGPDLRAGVKSWLFAHLLGHSAGFWVDKFAGRLAHKVMQASRAAVSLQMAVTFSITKAAAFLIAGVIVFAGVDLWLSVALIVWAALFVVATIVLGRRGVPLAEDAAGAASHVQGRVVDALSNVDLVRSFAAIDAERAVVNDGLDDEVRASRRSRLFWIGLHQAQTLLMSAFLAIVAAVAALRAHAGAIDAGAVATTISLALVATNRVSFFAERLLDAFDQYGVLKEALALITEDHAIRDRPDARSVPAIAASPAAVRFDRARFAYPLGEPLFEGLSFEVAPGEKLGVVGPSGAGKTTLLRLIEREWVVDGGAVEVAGLDVRAWRRDALAAAIAQVGQNAPVFHRSVRDNIAYGRGEASEAEIVAAAEAARCMEFLAHRPKGLGTVIGERGVKLSGGERQRVAIARALLKNAPILLLDEATSALDSRAERAVHGALIELIEGRTVIAVAHRLSTLTGMDRIIVLDRGRLAEQGDHATLLAAGGLYADLWRRQAAGGETLKPP